MNPWTRYKQLSRKTRKYIAVGLSIGIVLAGLAIPVPEVRSSEMKIVPPEPEPEASSVSVNVSSDMAEAEPALPPEPERGDPVEQRGIIGLDADGNVVRESRDMGREQLGASVEAQATTTTEQPQQKIAGALEGVEQETDLAVQEGLQNRFPELARYEEDVKNPNLQLYRYSEDDHGNAPDLSVQAGLLQYPVELGYPVDSNFGGALKEPLPNLMELPLEDTEEQENPGAETTETDTSENVNQENDLQSENLDISVSSGTQDRESGTDVVVSSGTQDGESGKEEDAADAVVSSGTNRQKRDRLSGEDASDTSVISGTQGIESGVLSEEDTQAAFVSSGTQKTGREELQQEKQDQKPAADMVQQEKHNGRNTKAVQSGSDAGLEQEGLSSRKEEGSTTEAGQIGTTDPEARVDETVGSGSGLLEEDGTSQNEQGDTNGKTAGLSLKDWADLALDEAEKLHLRGFLNNIYAIIEPIVPVWKEHFIDLEPVSDEQKEDAPGSGAETVQREAVRENGADAARENSTDVVQKEAAQENSAGIVQKETQERSADIMQKDTSRESSTHVVQKEAAQENSAVAVQKEKTQEYNSMSLEEQLLAEAMEEYVPVEDVSEESGEAICRILVRGLARSGREAYAGEIELVPTGENGFNRIRLESDDEYADSVVLREDASQREVRVFVTDGKEERSTVFSYSKDTLNPEIGIDGVAYQTLKTEKGEIFCTNSPEIRFSVQDGDQSAGIDRINLIYGDRFGFVFDDLEKPCYSMPEQFFGVLNYNCQDRAGNLSEDMSKYLLIEKDAPSIQIIESERYTAPYTMGISVEDGGQIVSGIQSIECTVNGEPYELNNITTTENIRLAEELVVPAKQAFSLDFKETGHYDISIRAIDHCGNAVILHKEIDVTEEELVAVFLSKEFKIYVDPDRIFDREQIFSEGLALKNISNVDTRVTIKEVNVNVKTETLGNGVQKDCQMYLLAPDTGERIPLKNGLNENVYSFVMPAKDAGTLSNLDFVGEINAGSEAYWKQDDIAINLKFDFVKTAD